MINLSFRFPLFRSLLPTVVVIVVVVFDEIFTYKFNFLRGIEPQKMFNSL